MGKKSKKGIFQQLHAIFRSAERYGIYIDESGLRTLVRQIQSGESEFVMKRTNRISIHKVKHGEQEVYVSFDKNTHNICSFLLQEHIDQYQKEVEAEKGEQQ